MNVFDDFKNNMDEIIFTVEFYDPVTDTHRDGILDELFRMGASTEAIDKKAFRNSRHKSVTIEFDSRISFTRGSTGHAFT